MTMNELPYEEYEGFYIMRGITMPAQGIFEVNVYSKKEELYVEEPVFVAANIEEAKAWIDQHVLMPEKSELLGVIPPGLRGRLDLYRVVVYGVAGGITAFTTFDYEPSKEELSAWVSSIPGILTDIDRIYVIGPEEQERVYTLQELGGTLSWAVERVREIYYLPLTKEEKYLRWAEVVMDKYYSGLLTEKEKTKYMQWEFGW